MPSEEGLVFAYELDGKGGGRPLDWAGVDRLWDDDGLVWVHLDYTEERAREWLHNNGGLEPTTVSALLSAETRPRSLAIGDGLLVIFRGVNLSPGADPEDMVSMRVWLEHHRVITLRQYRLKAAEDVRGKLDAGTGPIDAGGVLVALAESLVARVGVVVAGLEEDTDELEEEVLTHETHELRSRLAGLRRAAIAIRRYLAPQREAMNRLLTEKVSWLGDQHRARLRETTDRLARYVEDLDSMRDRAAVTHEELHARLGEQMNRAMYVLSVVAGIFLPLGLLTGLLGINVGGIPGVESAWAFWFVCGALLVVAVLEVILLRRQKWL
jgi:zinc transporter